MYLTELKFFHFPNANCGTVAERSIRLLANMIELMPSINGFLLLFKIPDDESEGFVNDCRFLGTIQKELL